jgi:hypothetical protein
LQLVCRQLRNETRCLVLRYNTITFTDKRDRQAAQDCAVLLQTLPENQARHLRTIAIQTSSLREQSSALRSIFDFCTKHPQNLVKYYLHPHNRRRDPLVYICLAHVVQYRFGKQFRIFIIFIQACKMYAERYSFRVSVPKISQPTSQLH